MIVSRRDMSQINLKRSVLKRRMVRLTINNYPLESSAKKFLKRLIISQHVNNNSSKCLRNDKRN